MNTSVIIPSLNSSSLEATLHAIARQTAIDRIESVIVAGQQDMPNIPGIPQLRYFPVPERPTPARNRNAGVTIASSDFVCFTDADCLPQVQWIERLLQVASNGAVALAGAVDIPPEMPYWGICDHLLGFENQIAGLAKRGPLDYAATLNFCIQRDLFTSLGGFDEHFERAGGEDRDLCWRLVRNGHQIAYVPSAIVIHHHLRTNFTSAWGHIYQYGAVTAQFRQRHLDQTSLLWRMGARLGRLPAIGEMASLGRVIARGFIRLGRQPALLQYLPYLPGMMLLDLAHSLGMIHTLRGYAA